MRRAPGDGHGPPPVERCRRQGIARRSGRNDHSWRRNAGIRRGDRVLDPWAERRLRLGLVTAVFVLVVAIWQGAVTFGHLPAFLVPAPLTVVEAAFTAFKSGVMWTAMAVTLSEALAGFALGSVLAVALGFLLAYSRLCKLGLYPYVVAFQAVPKVAVAPLIVVWFGFGMGSKVLTAALVAFFPMLVNTVAGLEATDPGQLELMRAIGASRWQAFRWVRWPNCLPYLFAGLEVGLIFSLIGAVVAEFVGSKAGLGTYILNLQFSMDTAGVFAALLVLSLLGVGLHQVLVQLGRRVIFWTRTGSAVGA
jgi:NitT/TauT family transport system permease protein